MSKRRRLVWAEDQPTHRDRNISHAEVRAYRVNDAAKAYSISRATIYRLLKANELRAVKIGGRRLILREDLRSLVTGSVR